MILLTVLSFNGAPTTGLAASFDELGGTIGRADNNQLVLPDPERSISRVHARIVFRSGAYVIVDSGSNPISVNGRTLGPAVEQPLKPGDQLQIGGYLLSVSAALAATSRASSDPFADLFGDIGSGLAAPQPMSFAPSPAAAYAPAQAPGPVQQVNYAPGQIPDDWDPFASHPTNESQSAPTAPNSLTKPFGPGFGDLQLGAAAPDSLDAMFGLGPASTSADPFGALPAAALPANTAAHADPLQSLSRQAVIGGASLGNHGSELNAAMPQIRAQMQVPTAPAPAPAPVSVPPAGAVFSWQEPAGEVPHTVPSFISRPKPRPEPAYSPASSAAPAPAPAPASSRTQTEACAPTSANAAPATAASGELALLSALLDGLGSPGLRIEALTPDLMRLIGKLLREATRGSVELLVARAAVKREMRAEMTMIVARENNPLKFSPSAEVALQYLLAPPLPGFMEAQPAMRDAFDDLRAHQLAVMAGMRSALEGVLQRFNPQRLEGELTQRSAISSLLPALRKARLWDLFQELFAQLSSEAQDEFEDLFGQAFLDAYEDQLDRLAAEPRQP
ncbi:type VI secretion system-associated FHA domain protein TagH [Roseateles oligotrophus]|uniref:Type VI secretion system-associated FHA domain protein TagH n=1 Tax=Roseateles oligotrophus TaxID=1769250 RepID=A0ABT2YG55_9BURK|nr:type VI secretion system-associated FHA domain protein TagH [Roseateles oligotrophus]MCV2369032.1 type VI secretion system-associated FHA domain protein TagH [Roseateles oligotrophus]